MQEVQLGLGQAKGAARQDKAEIAAILGPGPHRPCQIGDKDIARP